MTNIENFNDYAREAVLWSRNVLNLDEINFLKDLPLKFREENIDFVHASLHLPELWRYLLRANDTWVDFQIMESEILFIGHTHIPVIFEGAGKEVEILTSPEVSLDSNKKYIINPGSVGHAW